MRRYDITIVNACGVLVYGVQVQAKDENKAVLEVLKDVILSSGDTIIIDESEA